MNAKNTFMKTSLFVVIGLSFLSCKKSKEEQNRELLEYFKENESWHAAMSRPINHPVEGPRVAYYYKGKMINNTVTTTDISNSGWTTPSEGRNSGYGTVYPDSVFVTYGGLNNKLEMCTFEGGSKLPTKTIEKLFNEGYLDRNKKEKYKNIITGMAPGGRICVWVDHVEVARFKVKQKNKYYDKPVIHFGDENEILTYLRNNPVDYSVWEKPDSRFDLDYGFCSEDKKDTFFVLWFSTKEGGNEMVIQNDIDITEWDKPFGEKPNLFIYSGYQQIENTNKDYKLNLPIDVKFCWKKSDKVLFSTNVLMPKSLPERFAKSYTNPKTGRKSYFNRIVFGVEKDGEHVVVWIDGPDKQEKILRFKGLKASTNKEREIISGGYATDVTYY